MTVSAGDWSDGSVWRGGRVPGQAADVEVRHRVRLDEDANVGGLRIAAGAALSVHRAATRTLVAAGNVVVEGVLEMRPAPDAVHTLRFEGIDESAFVGEVEGPVESDVGLWVMGRGRLDAVGTSRAGWLRTTGGLGAGSRALTLESVPEGWRVGDEVVVVPTRPGDLTGFEERTLTGISGRRVTLSSGLEHDHPGVAGLTPEVANLTRNVRIEGTPGGRTHVFIHSTRPQAIEHVAIRHVGPRNESGFVLGRYGLHFHRMHDRARGSLVEGVVIRDAGSHSFVPHASHGVTIRDAVAYRVKKEAFWWDRPPDAMHNDARDALWDHCLAADVGGYGSEDQRASGFLMGSSGTGGAKGERNTGLPPSNVIRDSVAVGVHGEGKAMSGFQWPTGQSEPWEFEVGNVSHNNALGIFVWSNDAFFHDVGDVRIYNNEVGLMHGAYQNLFRYRGLRLVDNARVGVDLFATSGSGPEERQAGMDDVYISGSPVGLRVGKHNLRPRLPTVLSRWKLEGVAKPVRVEEGESEYAARIDLVDWRVAGRAVRCEDVEVVSIHPETVIRAFEGGRLLFRVTAAGCSR